MPCVFILNSDITVMLSSLLFSAILGRQCDAWKY